MEYEFDQNEIYLKVLADSSIKEGGGIIWDGAHVMVRFITKRKQGFMEFSGIKVDQELNVMELGAGTGFVGLAFAQMLTQSKVTLTEMSEGCIKLMQ